MNVQPQPSTIEALGQGNIVAIDEAQAGDPTGTKAAVIVQGLGIIFRIPLPKQEAVNLARALLSMVT